MKTSKTEPDTFRRSACPIANALELVGDQWSLLVIRDILHGKHTYGELLDSPEKISTSTLADRLKRLENAGILVSAAYQERPTRYAYSLSAKGAALGEILLAFVNWGTKHIPGTQTMKSFKGGRI